MFEMRISIDLVDEEEQQYNLAFGVWDHERNMLNDKITLKNGDGDRILATVGEKALEFLYANPAASIIATGSILPGEKALRTRKYQMGINANYDYLIEFCNIAGFVADKIDGEMVGDWPQWDGHWEIFDRRTNYDGFLLKLK